MDDLLQFYKEFLESLGCEIADNGGVGIRYPADANHENDWFDPVMVTLAGSDNPLPLYLPTPEVLKAGDLAQKVLFHPACEGLGASNSEVLNRVIDLIGRRLYIQYGLLITTVADLAGKPEVHERLSMRQKTLIEKLPKVSGTLNTYLKDVLKKCTGVTGDHPLLTIRLKRGHEAADGVKYSRVATLHPKILKEEEPLYGIKAAEVNKTALQTLLREVIFTQEVVGTSNAKVAPSFMALATMYSEAVGITNRMITLLGKFAGVCRPISESWIGMLDVVSSYRKYLPQTFPGNLGANPIDPETASALLSAPMPTPATPTGPAAKTTPTTRTLPGRTMPAPVAASAPSPEIRQRPMTREEYMKTAASSSYSTPQFRTPREEAENRRAAYQQARPYGGPPPLGGSYGQRPTSPAYDDSALVIAKHIR